MNIKNVLSALVLSSLILASCSKSNDTTGNTDGAILLSNTTRITKADGFEPDTQIGKDQTVGIYINDDGGNTQYQPNMLYTADGSGALKSGTTQYYPVNGNNIIISAYHPYNNGAEDNFDFTVKADQTTNKNYYDSDLLFCAEESYARQTTAHNLKFEHLLSKIKFTVVQGVGNIDITDAKVTFQNFKPTLTFNRSTGEIGAAKGVAAAIVPHTTDMVIVAPQTVAADTQIIKVELKSGAVMYYSLSGDTEFKSGFEYSYTIRVNETFIGVASTVTPWISEKREGSTEME